MDRKLLLGTVAAAGLILGIASARAADLEPTPGGPDWYVTLFGGISALEDFDVTYEVNGEPQDADANVDGSGFILGGAIGTHLTENIRVELETAYFESDVDSLTFAGGDSGSVDGNFDFVTVLANLWYDVPLSDEIKPYIGGGAGIAIVDGDVAYADGQQAFDSSEVVFAFQAGAGLRWAVSDVVTLDVGYRFKGIDGPSFEGSEIPGASDAETDWLYSHNLIGGISISF